MDVFAQAERMMDMDERTWMRHASPWSVWTRFFTCVPLISLAVWSRVWIGWYAVLPVALSFAWTWWNPRAFSAPRSTDNWASKGTFGERIFLERRKGDVPAHHVRAATVLSLLSGVGAIPWIAGLVLLDPWMTITGSVGVVLPKAWFVDRMVWIYEEMKDRDPRYGEWLRT